MKATINSSIYQLRICRQKTINISPFEAHFGSKANTPLSNISTEPDPGTLTYKPILKKYLDMETVRWDDLISDEQWDNDARSGIDSEKSRDRLRKDAVRRCNEDPNKESRVITHPDVGQAVPMTEASLTLKLAKKKPKNKRFKKNLDGLYEVLVPGSSVIKSDSYTSLIKEPGKREVTIRNSDLAKFGTKAERQTDQKNYADRRPKVPTGKITEDLINQRAKEARRKQKRNEKIKHKRIADDMSAVSSIHSNVSRALRVRMPTKPNKTIVPAPPQPPRETVTNFAPPMTLPQTSIVIAEPPTRPKTKGSFKRYRSLTTIT